MRSRSGVQELTGPPAILLGGTVNALSIARSLGRAGVHVYAINDRASLIHNSRYVRSIEPAGAWTPEDWLHWLLGPESDALRGAVILAASDPAVELLAHHRTELLDRFLLDDSDPTGQLCMLDKLCTYEAAAAAGVPTPRIWPVDPMSDLRALRAGLAYPLIVKPKQSHPFSARFGRKYFLASTYAEVVSGVTAAREAGIDVLLMELIPGPDSRLASYYTYLDEEGHPQFDFTKRIIRRHPVNMGAATYHVSDRVAGLREPSLALFHQVGLRGLANAEFKLDARDGILKLIECNARFTAATQLLTACGYDLGLWVYNRIVGRGTTVLGDYPVGVHLLSPFDDVRAFLELRSRGELTSRAWLTSLRHRQVLPLLDLRDPAPSLVAHGRLLRAALRRLSRYGSAFHA